MQRGTQAEAQLATELRHRQTKVSTSLLMQSYVMLLISVFVLDKTHNTQVRRFHNFFVLLLHL